MGLHLQEPSLAGESIFLSATKLSQTLHHPWVHAPLTSEEYALYLQRYQLANQKSYWVCQAPSQIVGVFNLNEIVGGGFQSAYMGFYAMANFSGCGLMSQGLQLVLQKIFTELNLHRVEANIQPNNARSINLVQRNGFRKEGYSPRYLKINGEWRDHERWAMTYEDWIGNGSTS